MQEHAKKSEAHEPPAHEPAKESHKANDKPVLSEGTAGQIAVALFKIDGITKSLNRPVTGAALYAIAGSPKSLSVGGKKVENDSETVDIEDNAEVKITR